MRRHPLLYEVNARILLRRSSAGRDLELDLSEIPESVWAGLRRRGFDLVWLMGVWRRSSVARLEALEHPGLRSAYSKTLPDWEDDDVAGSPYAVHDYSLDPSLGPDEALESARASLHRHGMGLVLDFVPNHLARDHPWVRTHPERFVHARDPRPREGFFSIDAAGWLAHGRDPHFPPWTDTAQVNFFAPEARRALIAELHRVAARADGVRCDMAMLALGDVFEGVWGDVADGSAPPVEFWEEAIESVKRRWPRFVFIAEVYWGMEQRLLDLGFDLVYDKTLYDRLRHANSAAVREHLFSSRPDPAKLVRFIENHDEPRAAEVFGSDRSLAAAVIVATVPGLRLFHDGQLEGRRARLPVQLVREPEEPVDPVLAGAYERLLPAIDDPVYHEGAWRPKRVRPASQDDSSHDDLLAWEWRSGERWRLVVVNYSPRPSRGRIVVDPPASDGGGESYLRDAWTEARYTRDREDLSRTGLFVELDAWRFHLLGAG